MEFTVDTIDRLWVTLGLHRQIPQLSDMLPGPQVGPAADNRRDAGAYRDPGQRSKQRHRFARTDRVADVGLIRLRQLVTAGSVMRSATGPA